MKYSNFLTITGGYFMCFFLFINKYLMVLLGKYWWIPKLYFLEMELLGSKVFLVGKLVWQNVFQKGFPFYCLIQQILDLQFKNSCQYLQMSSHLFQFVFFLLSWISCYLFILFKHLPSFFRYDKAIIFTLL